MRTRLALAAATLSFASLLVPPSEAQATGSVHISKIYYNSPGSDRGSNRSLNAEYVRIRNTRSTDVRLTGWTIRDRAGHVYTFGTYTLRAGASVTVRTGSGSDTRWNRYWDRSWYVWNNTGDKATLTRANGTVADTCLYRDKDTSAAFKLC